MFSSMLSLLGSLRGGGGASFVTNSLRLRSSVSAYLSRTPLLGNRKTWTWSAWVKRGSLDTLQCLFEAGTIADQTRAGLYFQAGGALALQGNSTGIKPSAITTAVFRDASAWYHVIATFNSSNATANDRMILYVNGIRQQLTTNLPPDLNLDWGINNNWIHTIARQSVVSASFFDGYLTEVNFIDGQALTPASFGAINSSTGVWAPSRYTGTYGTNGFYLKFADASAATAAAIGKDSSGNGNNWTPSGISVTAGATYDSMLDVPVNYNDGGNGRGNYCTLNPVDKFNTSISTVAGNLNVTNTTAGSYASVRSSQFMATGKWYCEFQQLSLSAANSGRSGFGIYASNDPLNSWGGNTGLTSWAYLDNGYTYTNSISTAASTGIYGASDIISMAFDADTGKLWFAKNGVWMDGGTPSAGTSPKYTLSVGVYAFGGWTYNTSDSAAINFGQRPFTYTPPAGFRALNTQNLPTPSIVNGANFMAATTYTGNAASRSLLNTVNNVSFQPDLVWIKSRTPGATNHALFDSVRGVTNYLSSNLTAAETTLPQSLTAFNADGFSLGTDTTLVNANANSYIAWQWKESALAGLDVVSYTGTGVARAVAHNLGAAPKMIIVKNRDSAVDNWVIYHANTGAGNVFLFTSTAASANATVWNNTAPTSSDFTVGTSSASNAVSNNYIAYSFAEIAGFSKFGGYTGNGSADGPFVFCGFRPRFVLIKAITNTGTPTNASWIIYDSSRNTFNTTTEYLFPNSSVVAGTSAILVLDLLSNGFKLKNNGETINQSGITYIFAAFAETPSKYALAR